MTPGSFPSGGGGGGGGSFQTWMFNIISTVSNPVARGVSMVSPYLFT